MPESVILLVEDDPTLRMVTRLIIKRLGYECEAVGSGEEALERNLDDISLVFMDIGLPGIQGSHATTLLREKELTERQRHLPIIGLTGHAAKEQCLEAGMDDFLQKPAFMDEIQGMLEKWLIGVKV